MNIKNFDSYDFSKTEINGVPIYYKNLPWSPCIHIRVVFGNGAFTDPVGKEGISHFLEHMLLKGCPSIPSKKAVKEWSKINALNTLNAFTNFCTTAYTLKCLPEKYDTILLGLKDMIFNSFISPEDVEAERKVIIQEAWGRFLNEKYLKYRKEFLSIVFNGNKLSQVSTALGWPETIEKISRQDILDWHKKNFGIGNFFIVMTGAVEDYHINKLEEFTNNLPNVNLSGFDFGHINKPLQNKIVKIADEIGEVKEQVEISMFRITEKTSFNDEEIASLSSRLIGDLLNEKLRTELSLCYGVSVQVWRSKDYTEMYIGIKTDEKNIELVEKEFRNVIDSILNKKQVERFNLIKNLYKEQMESQEFLSADIVDTALREIHRFDGHIITQKEQMKHIEKVQYDNIVKFIFDITNPEYLVTEIILPSKK